MVLEVRVLPGLFKKNKTDAVSLAYSSHMLNGLSSSCVVFFCDPKSAWLATFLGVFILNVDIGLYIGVGFSLLLVILRTQRFNLLGHLSSLFKDSLI